MQICPYFETIYCSVFVLHLGNSKAAAHVAVQFRASHCKASCSATCAAALGLPNPNMTRFWEITLISMNKTIKFLSLIMVR